MTPSPKHLPFDVQIFSANGARVPPQDNVLEDRWLHQLFLWTMIPAAWPGWKLAAALVAVAVLVWLAWWPAAGAGATQLAVILYLLFAAADWTLFRWLPRARRSFGPVGSQLLVCTVPRLLAALISAVAALVFGPTVGLAAMLLLQLFGSAVYFWAALREPFALGVTEQTVHSGQLPAGAPPIRLLHLSDLHVERLTSREPEVLRRVEQLRPDVIVITGDYLNLSYVDDPTARAHVRSILEKLSAPFGVYATLGSPPVDPRSTTPSLFDGLNIRLLRDEAAVLTLPDNRKLSLLGLDCEHDLESDLSAFEHLLTLTPADSMRVLLYHSPELMPQVQQHPVDLYLCGHTHGGQIRAPGYGAILTSSSTGKRYEMGRYDEQGTTLYISRGIGLEGLSAPRMRLLCPPEIIHFSLTAKN